MPDEAKWVEQFRRTAYGWLFGDFEKEEMPPYVILPFENPDLHSDEEFLVHFENISRNKTLTCGNYKNKAIGLLNSKFGAPAVAMTTDVLALAGVEGIIGVGYCGGLRADLDTGTLVIPVGAVRDESASEMYIPQSYPAVADLDIISALQKASKEAHQRAELGIVWSTDGILRETDEKIHYWKEQHVLAVDMETSSLLTVARVLGVKAGALLVVSDNPGLKRQADLEALFKGYKKAAQIALDAAVLLRGDRL